MDYEINKGKKYEWSNSEVGLEILGMRRDVCTCKTVSHAVAYQKLHLSV